MRLIVLALLALSLNAQDTKRVYSIQRSVSGTSNVITIRQPSSSGRPLELKGVSFKCSVTCTRAITKLGTVSGGSSGSASLMANDERGGASVSTITFDGTVSGASTIFTRSTVADTEMTHRGGTYLPFSSGSPKQLTVSLTAGSSGTLDIYVEWGEP